MYMNTFAISNSIYIYHRIIHMFVKYHIFVRQKTIDRHIYANAPIYATRMQMLQVGFLKCQTSGSITVYIFVKQVPLHIDIIHSVL